MKTKTSILFYTITIGAVAIWIAWILNAGSFMEGPASMPLKTARHNWQDMAVEGLHHSLAIFLMQITVIVALARLCGQLCKRVGQPAVMGEIIAGLLLGPSLLGTIAPACSNFLFPAASLGNLQMLSQIGLILFMFVVGMELDPELIGNKAGSAVVISHASIVIPYALGMGLAYLLYKEFAPANIPFYAFALFMGIAMSITAFPVLARLIRERGLSNTRLGALALTCAAADDVTAWCILALVIAIVKVGSIGGSLFTLALAFVYIAVMFFTVRPALVKLSRWWESGGRIRQAALAFVFVVLLLSAYVCEVIGIHALFGAFVAGVVMPHDWKLRHLLADRIEDVALVLLLPLFFVFTGLRTSIGLLNTAPLWGTCILIIMVAVIGKFGGSALAAKITGENTQDSLAIGALMNTRGLMELIVLNIGYDLGILSPQIFTMMVIMAIVTTFMTAPMLALIQRMKPSAKTVASRPAHE